MIAFEGASIRVQDSADPAATRTIVKKMNLQLSQQRIAIIGANGSGKSSLARLVNGLIQPSTGRVRVNGLDTVADGVAVRRHVGFVFTDPAAQLVMPTAIEDIELSLRRSGLNRSDRQTRAQEILAEYGLGAHAHASVHTLSGGQKQLLALAGVLATEPAILVCDEPTTLLDLRWRQQIDTLLRELPQQIVLVTHDLDAALMSDRVIVIDDGGVLYDGEPVAAIAKYRAHMAPAHTPAVPATQGGAL